MSVIITENSPQECCHHDFPHTDNQTTRSHLFKMIQKFQMDFQNTETTETLHLASLPAISRHVDLTVKNTGKYFCF